ncbi:hypothetical protein AAFF_G00427410 [Aldrovandia affinis]|uniref:B box-type domain-containing protein n=1 Tax=Aldrovandia affinis TaxID=143900 RepID=A0AAD7WIQ4_9TELE|nr:hypothetical protein AAFF_G00427410 [Aldrovandia affinis]
MSSPDCGARIGDTKSECPMCKSPYNILEVRDNPFLKDSTSGPGTHAVLKCAGCEGTAASGWCVECGEALCSICVSAHQRVRVTRDHTVLPQKLPTGFMPAMFCAIHKKEPMKLFCVSCNQLTCRDCQLTYHRNHGYQFLDEAVTAQREEIEFLMARVRQQRVTVKQSLEDLDGRLLDLEEIKSRMKSTMQKVLIYIRYALIKRTSALFKDVKDLCGREAETITERKNILRKLEERQEYILSFTEKALHTDNHSALLSCKRQVQSQLQDLLSQNTVPAASMIDVKFHYKEACCQIASFGKVITKEVPFARPSHNNVQKKTSHYPLQTRIFTPLPLPISIHPDSPRFLRHLLHSYPNHPHFFLSLWFPTPFGCSLSLYYNFLCTHNLCFTSVLCLVLSPSSSFIFILCSSDPTLTRTLFLGCLLRLPQALSHPFKDDQLSKALQCALPVIAPADSQCERAPPAGCERMVDRDPPATENEPTSTVTETDSAPLVQLPQTVVYNVPCAEKGNTVQSCTQPGPTPTLKVLEDLKHIAAQLSLPLSTKETSKPAEEHNFQPMITQHEESEASSSSNTVPKSTPSQQDLPNRAQLNQTPKANSLLELLLGHHPRATETELKDDLDSHGSPVEGNTVQSCTQPGPTPTLKVLEDLKHIAAKEASEPADEHNFQPMKMQHEELETSSNTVPKSTPSQQDLPNRAQLNQTPKAKSLLRLLLGHHPRATKTELKDDLDSHGSPVEGNTVQSCTQPGPTPTLKVLDDLKHIAAQLSLPLSTKEASEPAEEHNFQPMKMQHEELEASSNTVPKSTPSQQDLPNRAQLNKQKQTPKAKSLLRLLLRHHPRATETGLTDQMECHGSPVETEKADDDKDTNPKSVDEESGGGLVSRHWLPQVSMLRMPISVPPSGHPLPQFRLLPGATEDEILLQVIEDDDQSVSLDFTSKPEDSSLGRALEDVKFCCAACKIPESLTLCAECGRGFHKACHIPPINSAISVLASA